MPERAKHQIHGLDGITSMNRRDMLKQSIATGGAMLLSSGGPLAPAKAQPPDPNHHPTGGNFPIPSPKVERPFSQKLLIMQPKTHLPGGEADLTLRENGGVLPNGTVYPQITGGDALTTYSHSLERIVALQQRNSANNIQFSPQKFYVLRVQQNDNYQFHSEPPYNAGSVIWGYDGMYPGPTFASRHGVPILVRIVNELYELYYDENGVRRPRDIPGGFGDPRISTHLHNGHTGSESDGNPADLYPPLDVPKYQPQYPKSIRNLKFRDHHYAMFRAGLDPMATGAAKNDGDVAESISTLWYHDHSLHRTAQNTYKGLVGFHLVFDAIDSGDENDPAPALKLPSGEFDVPLLFQDKQFRLDNDGKVQLHLPKIGDADFSMDGVLGDVFLVNGRIQPKLEVKRRKYRFRLLNAGPSRFYKFFLVKQPDEQTPPEYQSFFRIGNDESLLPNRYETKPDEGLLLAVAERSDIVINFKRFNTGDKLYLLNRLVMEDAGFGPVPVTDANGKFEEFKTLPADESEGKGDYVLRFDVVGGDVDDPSDVPDMLRKNPDLPRELFVPMTDQLLSADDLKKLPNHRCFQFELDDSGQWVINGRPFASSPAGAAEVRVGKLDVPRNNALPGTRPDGEVWTIKNGGSGWAHPVHIHLEEFRILLRNGSPPKAYESCKKDVLRLDPDEEVQIFLRFRDFLGKYPIHCHNVLHEDHEMMLRFDVVGEF